MRNLAIVSRSFRVDVSGSKCPGFWFASSGLVHGLERFVPTTVPGCRARAIEGVERRESSRWRVRMVWFAAALDAR